MTHCCEQKLTPRDFTQTKLHAYLHDGHLKAKDCTITNTWDEVVAPAATYTPPYLFPVFFPDAACGDVRLWSRTDMTPAEHDNFTFVDVTCGSQVVTVVTRSTEAGHRVVAVDSRTWATLSAYESRDARLKNEQSEQQRLQDLNKDLK